MHARCPWIKHLVRRACQWTTVEDCGWTQQLPAVNASNCVTVKAGYDEEQKICRLSQSAQTDPSYFLFSSLHLSFFLFLTVMGQKAGCTSPNGWASNQLNLKASSLPVSQLDDSVKWHVMMIVMADTWMPFDIAPWTPAHSALSDNCLWVWLGGFIT